MLSKEGGRATRTRLLTAAYDLLVEEGYQSTTLQGVARRAGLSTGAIYCHFANEQELLALAVLDRWTQAQDEATAAARAGAGVIDDRLDLDTLTAVILNLYLGTITAKAWGLQQPRFEDTVTVLAAINRGLAPHSVGPPPLPTRPIHATRDITVDGWA